MSAKNPINGEKPRVGLREAVASGLHHSGALAALRGLAREREFRRGHVLPRAAEPRFVILCYHRVGVDGVPLYSKLAPAVFEAQMLYLRQHYRLLSLAELLLELEEPISAEPAVAITFDDGYRDLWDFAFPVLRRYQIPATIFAIGEAVETGAAPWYDRLFLALSAHPASSLAVEMDGPVELSLRSPAERLKATERIVGWLRKQPDDFRLEFCAEFARRMPVLECELAGRMLTWEQLRVMQQHGVTCGAHTMSHPALSQVPSERRTRELRDARELLAMRLGRDVLDFAFPFGQPADCAGVTDEELTASGYRSAATTTPGANRCGTNPYALKRVSIAEEPHLPLFAYRLNSLFLNAESSGHSEPAPAANTLNTANSHAPSPAEAILRGEGR